MLALLLSALQIAAPAKGTPPLTELTKRSGGERPAEQLALRLESEDLAIEVLPERHRLEGVATLRFTVRAPVRRLLIDLDRNLPVSAVAIDGAPLPPGSWSNPDGRLVIRLPRAVPAGRSVTARIRYGGTPHVAVRAPWDDGVVWSRTPDGQPWFATTAQGSGCDLFRPCLDHPAAEPAVATLAITVPAGLSAPSDGRLLGVDRLPDGRSTWRWRVENPNSYGIALNVGPYAEIAGTYRSRYGNAIPLRYWHLPGKPKGAAALFAEFAPTLDFFESVIGPYPFGSEKVGVVETPHLGMEHQTINAYGNGYAKAVEGFDWLFHHEFAHEWFANQLTAVDWDDFWLHEGFASYMQPLYGRWREGEARYAAMMDKQRQTIRNRAPLISGRSQTANAVYDEAEGGPAGDIYVKGSWVLHTLRNLIGDAAFFDATRRLVYGRPDPRPGNFRPRLASTAEFEAIVAQVTGRDHRWFFDAYVRRAALPELTETRTGDRLMLAWKSGGPFPMPVEVQVDGRTQMLAMTGGIGTLSVPPGAHVVIDPHARVLKRSRAIEEMQAWQATKR